MSNASSRKWTLRVNVVAASPFVTVERRVRALRRAGMNIGHHVDARPHSWIFCDLLTVGDDTLLGDHCLIHNVDPVFIGARCAIAPAVTFNTSTHDIGEPDRRGGPLTRGPITVGDGCWIGTRAVILSGVTIGRGSVIAAGAIVTTDCAADSLYGGVPARFLRHL